MYKRKASANASQLQNYMDLPKAATPSVKDHVRCIYETLAKNCLSSYHEFRLDSRRKKTQKKGIIEQLEMPRALEWLARHINQIQLKVLGAATMRSQWNIHAVSTRTTNFGIQECKKSLPTQRKNWEGTLTLSNGELFSDQTCLITCTPHISLTVFTIRWAVECGFLASAWASS